MKDKNIIRSEIKNREIQNRIFKDAIINCLIYESDIYQNADEIFLYYSHGNEPDLSALARNALMDGKRVAFPVTVSETEMVFRYINDFDNDFTSGAFGISEPKEELEAADFSAASERTILCPGLAFDTEGRRLGHGKGYYDRFLEKYGMYFGSVTGICYSEFVYPELPSDEHDITMDYILTEQEWIK